MSGITKKTHVYDQIMLLYRTCRSTTFVPDWLLVEVIINNNNYY